MEDIRPELALPQLVSQSEVTTLVVKLFRNAAETRRPRVDQRASLTEGVSQVVLSFLWVQQLSLVVFGFHGSS